MSPSNRRRWTRTHRNVRSVPNRAVGAGTGQLWRSGRWASRPALVVPVLVLALSGCGSRTGRPSALGTPTGDVSVADSTASAPSVEDVVATAQRSLRDGGVLHEKVTVTQDAGDFSYTTSRNVWLDGAGDAFREARTFAPHGRGLSTLQDRLLAVDGVLWSNGKVLSHPATCYGGGAVVSALLGCPSLTDDASDISVRRGSWHGIPALVLLFHRTSGGEDTTETVDGREFLDAKTALPLAQQETGRITGEGDVALHRTTTFAGSFVDATSVAADFFDPASFGWHPADPEKDLPTDVPVYWLGRTFHPGVAGLPVLRLSGVENHPDAGGGPGYAAILEYGPADDPVAPPALTIQVWTQEALDASHIVWGNCATQTSSNGPMQITLRCPNVDARSAEVRTGGMLMLLDAPGFAVGRTITDSPYDTPEALLTAARALTLWQPPMQQP
jgi:hypothetical protein